MVATKVRALITGAIALAAVGVPLLAWLAPQLLGPLWAAALWGLGLILCFAGWGAWLKRRLLPDRDVDWGLRCAWGLALTVGAGGALCALGLARRPVLLVWICAGLLLVLRELYLSPLWRSEQIRCPWRLLPLRWDLPVVLALFAVAGVIYVGSAGRGNPNPSDDWIAYLPFVRMILDTGTTIDPFSVRRMAAYGGQSYLQALVLIVADESQIQVFDQGICLLMTLGLIFGFAREAPNSSRVMLALIAAAVVMLPEIRINSAAEMSGALGFVTVFRTIVLVRRLELRDRRAALLIALPIAAVCTLRQNYLLTAGIVGAALLLGGPDQPWRERRRQVLETAALTAVCLLPWAVLAFRSNGTVLYPIFPGNYDPNYAGLTAPSSWAARWRILLAAASYDEPVRTMPLLLLAAPAFARRWHGAPLWGLWLGTVSGFALLAISLPDADTFALARYGFASIVGLTVAIGLAAAEQVGGRASGAPSSVLDLSAVGLVLIALCLQIQGTQKSVLQTLARGADRIAATDHRAPPPLQATAGEVAALQAAAPPGQSVFVMIERPYLLDYRRNRIFNIDLPGAASPPPHLPLTQGGEKVAAYLQGCGIRYFAFTRPDKAQTDLYRRANWLRLRDGRTRIWRLAAPLYLAMFDTVDELARTRARVFDNGHLVLVDLATAGS